MQVFVNGEVHTLASSVALAALLQQLGYCGEAFAVAVNGRFVPRTEYAATAIHQDDRLDIVAPVVGG
ncbi:sulfur carrier protein ThiS [uncultured Microbulbifer sp.]|uniref:sulfur carrier protein ThiS n=1 Tax=uncultured Microbulbifer sp. TaxID=348147 RepID=UPI002608EAFD|nr:sulfur carrier protein ThiS [uncultured Microbulbifer sp.]